MRKRKTAARKHTMADLEAVHMQIIHVRAAMLTVAVALQGKGVHDEMSVVLRGANARLDPCLRILDDLIK